MLRLYETIAGLYELLQLAVRTRYSSRNPYWQWRLETAFGADRDAMPSRWQRLRAMIEYGRWVHRMKRWMRP